MVTPVNDVPNKKIMDITGEDFTGLVKAAQIVDILMDNEATADFLIDEYMADLKSDFGSPRENIKAGFAHAIGTIMKNVVYAAESAEKMKKD